MSAADGDRIFLGHTTGPATPATLTRPNNATPYTAGDVIGTALALPGTSHVVEIKDVARSNGGSGMIPTALLIDSANQAVPPSLELWLFSVAPAAQIDNDPFAVTDAELLNLIGVIPLTAVRVGNPAAAGAGNLVIESDVATMSFKCAPGTTSLFGVYVVRNAYTPVANEALTTRLSSLQDY